MNLPLLCGDVLQNPGPTTVKCYKCRKAIRRNQGRATCVGCTQPYHLKCLGADFGYSSKCGLCSITVMNATEEENLTKATVDFVGPGFCKTFGFDNLMMSHTHSLLLPSKEISGLTCSFQNIKSQLKDLLILL